LANREEKPYPNETELARSASFDFAQELAGIIRDYADQYGI